MNLHPPASTSHVLGWQACSSAGNRTKSFMHARQTLSLLSYRPSLGLLLLRGDLCWRGFSERFEFSRIQMLLANAEEYPQLRNVWAHDKKSVPQAGTPGWTLLTHSGRAIETVMQILSTLQLRAAPANQLLTPSTGGRLACRFL